ncbi:MAG: transposase [Actinomycetota bacterium]|nr:transposase [Actinomycetota bacterium]
MVSEIVGGLDTFGIEAKYSPRGQNTYHPKLILKLLFYGYATGVRSGRRIARACESDTAFMYLAQMRRPDFRTINDFRKNHTAGIEEHLKEMVRICREL